MTVPRSKFGGASLADGRVIIAGGQAGGAWGTRVTSTQIYDPATGRFYPGPELNEHRFKLSKAVVSLKDGRVLIAGGAERPEVYDPQSRAFIPVDGATLDGFCFSTATLLNDGRVLLAGGYSKPRGCGSQPRLALYRGSDAHTAHGGLSLRLGLQEPPLDSAGPHTDVD